MGQQTLSYCTPVVLISLKFSSMRLTPGLSSHHYHPEFGETLQYDMANGLAIDFVRERKREWQMERKSKGNIWKGTGRKGVWRASGVRRYRRIVQGTHTILLKSTTVSGKWKREFLQDKYLKSVLDRKRQKKKKRKAECVSAHSFRSHYTWSKRQNVHFYLVLKAVALYTALEDDNFALTNPIIRAEELRGVFALECSWGVNVMSSVRVEKKNKNGAILPFGKGISWGTAI